MSELRRRPAVTAVLGAVVATLIAAPLSLLLQSLLFPEHAWGITGLVIFAVLYFVWMFLFFRWWIGRRTRA